jgi:hypothetical protein
MTMLYPVYVHPVDATHSHGAEVPDFPGCFSAADDLQDLKWGIRRIDSASTDPDQIFNPLPSTSTHGCPGCFRRDFDHPPNQSAGLV